MINVQAMVLAGYIRYPWLRSRAKDLLEADVFTAGYKAVWKLCCKLSDKLTFETLYDTIQSRLEGETQRLLHDTVETVEAFDPVLADWGYSLGEALSATRLRVLERGLESSARCLASNKLSEAEAIARGLSRELDRYSGLSRAIIQDARKEARHTLSKGYSGTRWKTGLSAMDKLMQGFRRPQFVLWGGFSHEAKTSWTIHCMENFAHQGANVLYVTLEMSKKEILDLFLCVHSHRMVKRTVKDEEVTGIPYQWFNDPEIRTKLSDENKSLIHKAIDSFESTPGGVIHICHPLKRITIEDVIQMHESECDRIGKIVDIVVVDYMQLLDPAVRVSSTQEGLRDTMIQSKRFVHTANRGEGVMLWSPWQMRRGSDGKAVEEAKKRGYYGMWDFAESSFAERATDVMGWNMMMKDDPTIIKQGICKNRTTRKTTIHWREHGWVAKAHGDTCLFADRDGGKFEGVEPDLE